MADKNGQTSRKIPKPVTLALEALERLKREDAPKALSVRKILPAYAMKLAKQKKKITVEGLLEQARLGASSMVGARSVMTAQEELSYESVLNRIKERTPRIISEDHAQQPLATRTMEVPIYGQQPLATRTMEVPRYVQYGALSSKDYIRYHYAHYAHFPGMIEALYAAQSGDLPGVKGCPGLAKHGSVLEAALKLSVLGRHVDMAHYLLDIGAGNQSGLLLDATLEFGDIDIARRIIATTPTRVMMIFLLNTDCRIRDDLFELFIDEAEKRVKERGAETRGGWNDNGFEQELFINAVRHGHAGLVNTLLSRPLGLKSLRGSAYKTVLDAREKDCDDKRALVDCLVRNGVEIDESCHLDLVNSAIKMGDFEILQMILDAAKRKVEWDEVSASMSTAVRKNSPEMVKFLLDRGFDIHAGDDAALGIAVHGGNKAMVNLLLDRGAFINAQNGGALRTAVENKDLEMAALLLDRGAFIQAADNEALFKAVDRGDCAMTALLLDRGANINARHGALLWSAFNRLQFDVCELLLDRGAKHMGVTKVLKDGAGIRQFPILAMLEEKRDLVFEFPTPENKALYEKYKETILRWKKIAHRPAPPGLEMEEPALFRPVVFEKIVKALEQEGYGSYEMGRNAFAAAALFGTEARLWQYLDKWGEGTKKALHDVVYMIQLPEKYSPAIDLKSWGDAALKCGPDMAALFKFADGMLQPEKSADGRSWSLQKTREKSAQFVFKRGTENPELAALCVSCCVSESSFNAALDIVKECKAKAPVVKRMPDITLDGQVFDMEGAKFSRLPANDVRGLFLGALTDCCQSINGAGSACAKHGYSSENGGFYVLEKNNQIVGQTWAWRGKKGELVFDSLETLGNQVKAGQWRKICEAFAEAVSRNPGDITALHVGDGGDTPDSLKNVFMRAAANKPAFPLGYDGYRDSHSQLIVWESKEKTEKDADEMKQGLPAKGRVPPPGNRAG